MNIARGIAKRIRKPKLLLLDLNRIGVVKLSEKRYLELWYESNSGYSLDLDHPKTFNEKIQWMKLYYRNPELPGFVDKAEAKKRVAKIIGKEYIIPTIGVYDNFDEIDFDELPNQFVIKCTHDCASAVICDDKNKLNIEEARKKINKALEIKYYGENAREWAYSQIEPRIIIEKFMEDTKKKGLTDYKIFCFSGEPKIMYVSDDSHTDRQKIAFFDMDYNNLHITRSDYKNYDKLPPKPKNFEKMKEIAKVLSKQFPEVRVDLYEINDKIYFGELTFYTCGGMVPWEKREYDEMLGEMIELPKKYND